MLTNVLIKLLHDESKRTSYGFKHISTFVIEWLENAETHREVFTGEAKYYNRTWEVYRFQRSRQIAYEKVLKSREESLKRLFLESINKKRLSTKTKCPFLSYLNSDPIYSTLTREYHCL